LSAAKNNASVEWPYFVRNESYFTFSKSRFEQKIWERNSRIAAYRGSEEKMGRKGLKAGLYLSNLNKGRLSARPEGRGSWGGGSQPPLHQLWGLGSAVSSPSGVRGGAPENLNLEQFGT